MKFVDNYFEELLLVGLISAMSVLIIAQIFMRFVIGSSITWSEELARYLFIWMTWIGTSYGVKKHAHIRVNAVTQMFPPRLGRYINILTYLIFLLFCGLVIKEGIAMTEKIFRFNQQSASLRIPMGYVYLAPVVGLALTALRLLQAIHQEIRVIRGSSAP
jgi:TRAP-type C4-dicarboxylate transport system permease small subunit